MTLKESYKLTIYVSDRQVAISLQKLAASLGYIQQRGPAAGEKGAIGQLMEAIANGQLTVSVGPLADGKDNEQ